MSIDIQHINKTFATYTALKDINLSIKTGELVALLGPSGSGKTTLLRIIAGLEQADSGKILLNGADTTNIPVRRRQVGFVFQHYALFKHLTVFDNIGFGLTVRDRGRRPSKAEIAEKVRNLLKLIQLPDLAKRYPGQLSGGQRQRVALARALAIDPRVLLLDEPFGALDAKVRKDMRRWVRQLHDELHITTVFVTHDQEEALEISDRVVVMNNAVIEQIGAPQEVYDHPSTPFVCQFLGNVNAVPSEYFRGDGIGYVRPHDIEISRSPNGATIESIIKYQNAAGPIARLELGLNGSGQTIAVELPRDRFDSLGLRQGEKVFVKFREVKEFAAIGT